MKKKNKSVLTMIKKTYAADIKKQDEKEKTPLPQPIVRLYRSDRIVRILTKQFI
mgnify:CR=1 FL=1